MAAAPRDGLAIRRDRRRCGRVASDGLPGATLSGRRAATFSSAAATIPLSAALLAAGLVDLLLVKGFGRLAKRTRSQIDDQLIALLRQPLRTSLVLVGLAFVDLHLDPTSLLPQGVPTRLDLTHFLLQVLASLAILIWTVAGLRIGRLVLAAASGRSRLVETRTLPLFQNVGNILVVAAAIYFVFVTWGIDLTAWLASAGILGIAIGFAAKDTLANLFAGIFILADAPYKVGDVVNLASGERGQVTHVGIRSTRLLTRDDIEITIPNAVIANAKIANESSGRWTKQRVRVKVGVAYGSDIDRVRALLEEIAVAEPDVCEDPEPRVRFRSFGDSGLDLELLAWIEDPADRGKVIDQLNTTIYKRFAAESIEIPYPKRDLYLRGAPPGELPGAAGTRPGD